MNAERHLRLFQGERNRLTALAYRMTGSVTEAEDILQEAWIRFARQDLPAIEEPRRWLGAAVMRLCLDHLKSARRRRETYIGAWLPEPLVEGCVATPEDAWMVAEDVNIALILTLHSLSPEMRAAFILRDAFDYDFEAIADIVGRTPATCRQLVSRARRRMAGAEPPARPPSAEATPILQAFWRASRQGDIQQLLDLFADEIEVHTDGGGRVRAALNVLHGKARAARFFAGLARKWPWSPAAGLKTCVVNGSPGFVARDHWGGLQTTAIDIVDGQIRAIWIVRNPEKLMHLSTFSHLRPRALGGLTLPSHSRWKKWPGRRLTTDPPE